MKSKNISKILVFLTIIAVIITLPVINKLQNKSVSYSLNNLEYEDVDVVTFTSDTVGKVYKYGTDINDPGVYIAYAKWNGDELGYFQDITEEDCEDVEVNPGEIETICTPYSIDQPYIGATSEHSLHDSDQLEIISKYWQVTKVDIQGSYKYVTLKVYTAQSPISLTNPWIEGKIYHNGTLNDIYLDEITYHNETGDEICTVFNDLSFAYNYAQYTGYIGHCDETYDITNVSQCWEARNVEPYVYVDQYSQTDSFKVDLYPTECVASSKLTNLTIKKVWNDENDRDGIRPDSLDVYLNGTIKITLYNHERWTANLEDLPLYDENDNIIEYTVTEPNIPEGYTLKGIDKQDGTVTITNEHEPAKITIEGYKQWNDGNDRDGLRPDTITINLKGSDGTNITKEVEKGPDNNWHFTFENLPMNKNGRAITYTLTETQVTGYEKPVITKVDEADNVITYQITNTHTPNVTDITVNKVWDDDNNKDGLRPGSVTVQLLADGTPVEGGTVVLDETTGWTHTFEDLPKFNGTTTAIVYSVVEVVFSNDYEDPKYESNNGIITITNKHVPQTTSITINKEWVDEQNENRPTSIAVNIYANGTKHSTIDIKYADNWTKTIELPKYINGALVEYTVEEDEVDNYDTEITTTTNNGIKTFNIKNTLKNQNPNPGNDPDPGTDPNPDPGNDPNPGTDPNPDPEINGGITTSDEKEDDEPSNPTTSTGITMFILIIISAIIAVISYKKIKSL